MQINPIKNPVLAQVVVLVLVGVGFLSGIDNFFAGDDFDWLFTTVKTVENPRLFFGVQSNFVRHGESLFFIVNYLLAGFYYPVFFLSSLLIHLVNVLLVCRLLARIGCGALPALLGGLLWGLNYRLSEVLFRPYGVADSLALIFGLAALLLFIDRRPWLAGVLLLGGLFCKENALVFPALSVAWVVLLEPREGRGRRVLQSLPQWLAVALFVPLLMVLRAEESSYIHVDMAVVPRFWENLLSLVGPDAVYLRQVVFDGDPWLSQWLAIALLPLLAVLVLRMPERYQFGVVWIVVTLVPTLFVTFQTSRYYYVPLVGVAIVVAVLGRDVVHWAEDRGSGLPVALAGGLFALYLCHSVWGVQLEESDYAYVGDLHRRAAESMQENVIGLLPGPGEGLGFFVRPDTMVWAERLIKRHESRPWYWPTTHKWIYRRPHGVLGMTNTWGFVTYCADRRREVSLFVAARPEDYREALAREAFVVVVHDAVDNSFHVAPEQMRRELASAAGENDLYRYLQPGRFDPTATGSKQLGR
jgi:hypothetical protein